MTGGVVLDAGALIGLERKDRRMTVLLARALETGARVTVPASVLAQVVRRPASQVRLTRLLRQPTTATASLDRVEATSVGLLLAATATTDIADAQVIICARRTGDVVVTCDAEDMRRLDPNIPLVVI